MSCKWKWIDQNEVRERERERDLMEQGEDFFGGAHTPVSAWVPVDPASAGPSSAVSARKLAARLRDAAGGPHRCRREDRTQRSSIRQDKWNRRVIQALHPVPPYSTQNSSTEVSSVNHATSPTSSSDFRTMPKEEPYSLKTSTELVKLLNRIWNLEEQHASRVSQVKELKVHLKNARARIQELMYERRAYSQEIDDLMKQIMEEKLIRKKKEQDKFNTAFQSIRDELEDERKLRIKSEILHRKLAKEISEVKAALLKALDDLDREKEANGLAESVCDVLAEGVENYDMEVRELQQKTCIEHNHKGDRWVLHLSEAWLDERLQMKVAEARGYIAEKATIINRLRGLIMGFLQSRQSNSTTNVSALHNNVSLHRQSLESVHLNGATSAPRDVEDADSVASGLPFFELNLGSKESNGSGKNSKNMKVSGIRRHMGYYGQKLGQSSSYLQTELTKLLNSSKAYEGNKMHITDELHVIGLHDNTEAESHEANKAEINLSEIPKNSRRGVSPSPHKSNFLIHNSKKIPSELCESKDHGDFHGDHCHIQCSKRGQSSPNESNNISGGFCILSTPVLQHNHCTTSYSDVSECSWKSARTSKDKTLKAKLLEAKLEGRHARMRSSKCSSIVEIEG